MKEECLNSVEATTAVLRNFSMLQIEEILIECLLEDILKEVPEKWHNPKKKQILHNLLKNRIELIKDELLAIAGQE